MRTLLRVIAIVLGVVVVLVAAAALILPRVIDPNVYREQIAALVEQRTGRELTIGGDIGWSVFPWLGVELGEVQLANAPGFGAEPFVQVAAMQVRVKLLPLLRKEVEMSTVVLDGLQVRLAKAKDGRTNWADLFAAKGEREPRKPAPSERKTSAAMSPAAIAVGGLRVRDATLIWDDRAAGAHYTVDEISLQTDAIRGDQPIGVELDFNAKGAQPAFEAKVRLRAQVLPTRAFTHVAVRDLHLEVSASGKQLPRGGLDATLNAQLAYAADRNSLELDDLVVNALDVTLRGQARGSDIGGAAPRLDGSLRIDAFAPRELMTKLRMQPPETSDPNVLQRAEADAEFTLTVTGAELRKLKLRADDSLLTGSLRVQDFAKPSTQFQLALDRLDLDRYLPPPAAPGAAPELQNDTDGEAAEKTAGGVRPQAAAKESRPQTGRKSPPPLLPVAALRDLRLNGSLHIGEFKAYQIRSNDVDITLSAANGTVRITPARAKLYQGRYDGNITIDVSGKQPRFALNEKLSGVQIGPLLKDLQGDAKLTGTADIALKLSASGNRAQAIRRNMNGDARFALTDGTVKGMDVLGEIRRAYAVVRGKAPAKVTDETEFSALTGSATVTKGVVTNRDLQGKSPLMQIQGSGTANLVTDALDYRVTATLVDALEGEGELTGRPIPVRITGTLAKPKVGVDLQQVIKQEARKQVEKKIQEKLQDNLKGGLKGLLGQ